MARNIKTSSPEENLLVRFVRGQPLGPALAPCRADEVSRLAILNKVVWPLAVRVLEEKKTDASWRRWAAAATLASERDAARCAKAARKTVALLESDGMAPVLLKGASLALGKPRDSGDVDLLIPETALFRAISILEGAGYSYRGYDRNMYIRRSEYRDWERLARWANQFEFSEPETGTLVELHTAFFESGRVYSEDLRPLRKSITEFFAASAVDPATGYRFLATEDRVLLLALHAGLKRSPSQKSFILRHLLDLRALVDAGLDWEKLRQRAFRFGAEHHLAFLLRLDDTVAGSLSPAGYMGDLESRLAPGVVRLIRLHLSCLKSVNSYDRWAIFAYRYLEPFLLRGTAGARLRSFLVLPLVFPPPHELAAVYRLPKRFPLTFLFYLLEPFRAAGRLARKVVRTMAAP